MTEARAIVRLFGARVTLDELARITPLLEEHIGRYQQQWRTVFAHWIGVRHERDDADLAIVTGWESERLLREIESSAGGQAVKQGPLAEIIRRGRSEDFRLVDQLASSFAPGEAAVLRIVRLPVRPEREDELLALIEPVRLGGAQSGDLAVTQVLRGGNDAEPLIVVIALWRDAAALMRSRGARDAPTTPSDLLRVPEETATYDLLPVSALKLAPEASAVVVADDTTQIVDVTPAAARLLGRDAWDLLGQRLAAFSQPDGADHVRFFERPEGGRIRLSAVEVRDFPAPGRHATLLRPGSSPDITLTEVRAAVAAAYGWRDQSSSSGPSGLGAGSAEAHPAAEV